MKIKHGKLLLIYRDLVLLLDDIAAAELSKLRRRKGVRAPGAYPYYVYSVLKWLDQKQNRKHIIMQIRAPENGRQFEQRISFDYLQVL